MKQLTEERMDASADRKAAGLAAMEAGQWAEAYSLLLPLAEAGDAEVQGVVGSLMQGGLHRFENLERFEANRGQAIDDAVALADREQCVRFLQAASSAGFGVASFNLASVVVDGYGGGPWEERKARAAELYALGYAQGFTAFGWLMHGNGPGQPYLDILERYAASAGCRLPGEPPEPEVSDDQ